MMDITSPDVNCGIERRERNTTMSVRLIIPAMALCISGPLLAQSIPDSQRQNPWFQAGQSHISTRVDNQAQQTDAQQAKNVILFVGDGMGVATLTTARILGGQRQGLSGEESSLSFERFAHTALVKTYNANAQIPDSAGTMSAMVSGIKTNAGVVGVTSSVLMGNCTQVEGNEMVTALELAEIKGLATGIVTNTRITHATPAATFAKSASRGWEDISDMSDVVIEQGCEDIASQLVGFEPNLEARFPNADVDGIDVVFGGGRRHFLSAEPGSPETAVFGQDRGDRTDGRNLIAEWQQRYPAGRYIFDEASLQTLDTASQEPVFGLFNSTHMPYEADIAANPGSQPSLSTMVGKAIEVLGNDPDGFLLIVEAGRIDQAHHAGNAFTALDETLELARAVTLAEQLTSAADTLIMVTADHSHVLTFAGHPRRGNPILGKVVSVGATSPALADDGLPYTTLGYANGPGFRNYADNGSPDRTYAEAPVGGRQNLGAVDTQIRGFHQEALVPLVVETHGGEDVTLHANGPGAFRVRGTIEQNVIFHIMNLALGLTR